MPRLLGFFLLAFVLVHLLRALPGVGHLFGGFFSFWIVLILLGVGLSKLGRALTARRRVSAQVRSLVDVESPHNQGKLGSLLLAHGRVGASLAPLGRAVEGEPEVAEWSYRLGLALLARGRSREAVANLERSAAIDEEHAYGGVQLALSRARLADGDSEGAAQALALFERNHGPSPESAYLRGRALQRAGQRSEARAAFEQACDLGRRAARFQRARNRPWVLRAWLARLG